MNVDIRPRKRAAVADRKARAYFRNADPVLARVIDARPGFRPRAWLDELPPPDAFGTLIFQVAGQRLAVAATRTIVSRLQDRTASCSWRSTGRTSSSRETSRFGARFNAPMDSTTFRAKRSWPRWRTAGDRIGVWR